MYREKESCVNCQLLIILFCFSTVLNTVCNFVYFSYKWIFFVVLCGCGGAGTWDACALDLKGNSRLRLNRLMGLAWSRANQ